MSFGTPGAKDLAAAFERNIQDAKDEITPLIKELITELMPRPVGSEKVDPELDFEEWAMENAEAKNIWVEQKMKIYGVPRAARMFLEREEMHEKRLRSIPTELMT